jgi:RND family efflux transporter MFP subunit
MLGAAHAAPFPVPAASAAAAAPGWVTVTERRVVRELQAYGQIEPIAVVRVRTGLAGTLRRLDVVPGSVVKAGEVLARIGGPRMRALAVAREQALRAASAREAAAARTLGIARRQFQARLATAQQVSAAQAEWAAATASASTARARWKELEALRIVRAPAAGTVLALHAAAGEQLGAGQALVTLQPAAGLWIRASYYGADTAPPHVGMRGDFRPAGGGESLPVRVAAISPALAADGGLSIGLLPVGAPVPPWWRAGQWGTLSLPEPARQMVMVPTQALILDRGRWWVLLHAPGGDTRQAVVPGPTQGWRTAIVSGLKAGQQVVVTDAFLEYHRGIARDYTPPD